MSGFTTLTSRVVPLPVNDIDTDQIIPARFLKAITKDGLGQHLFADWRYNADGSPKADFVINKTEYKGAQILLAGDNFGCGSSREHAPWALTDSGFRAVLSTSFADIFRGNAMKNGLLPVILPAKEHAALVEDAKKSAGGVSITITLADQTVSLPNGSKVQFDIEPFAKRCLLEGVDELGFLLSFRSAIEQYEQNHPSFT
jgi:3-isopropylmalate/(R)-2-methylmalate dehydratase small subunit